jgi:predicted secreted protein
MPARPPAPAPEGPRPAAGTPAGQAAAAAVVALGRAARSFSLYDARNEAIRQLLEAYRQRSREALDRFGDLVLEVGPFDIALRGEGIYRDQDREKSLAFKLFRDGVRRLTITAQADWGELLQLLEIVALRYSAVRQQEEDAVTLLRKSGLAHVKVVAVEGFVPSEERPEPEDPEAGRRAVGVKAPEGWDTPLPRLPSPATPGWQEVSEEALQALRADASDEGLTATALGLGRDLLAEAVRGGWPRPNRDLVAFFGELRDSFLADGELGALRQLVDLIVEAGAGEVREELLSGLGDARTLDLILEGIPEKAAELPPDLLAFVPLLGLSAALERLAVEEDVRRKGILLKLVLARLPREAEAVLARLPTLEPGLARSLASGLVARAPERALEVARLLLGQRDDALRLEGLDALSKAPGEVPLGPVVALLSDPAEGIRLKAAEVVARRGDESAVGPIVRILEQEERGTREVEGLGRVLAELAPIPAARLFGGWLNPKGRFLVGLNAQQRRLQWAAVSGLAAMPGEDAERQVQALAQEAGDELRKHCLAALARRRRGAGTSHG